MIQGRTSTERRPQRTTIYDEVAKLKNLSCSPLPIFLWQKDQTPIWHRYVDSSKHRPNTANNSVVFAEAKSFQHWTMKLTHRTLNSATSVLGLSLQVNLWCIFNNPLYRHLYKLVKRVELLPDQSLLIKVGTDDNPTGFLPKVWCDLSVVIIFKLCSTLRQLVT